MLTKVIMIAEWETTCMLLCVSTLLSLPHPHQLQHHVPGYYTHSALPRHQQSFSSNLYTQYLLETPPTQFIMLKIIILKISSL